MSKPHPIPVYLITGLLGSGKTTLLLNLIKQKPANENWGILINEFGEIDIDSILLADHSHSENIAFEALSGGCICCSATLGLNQAINNLINLKDNHQIIDRLFIEPTGLGHPARIIDLIAKSEFIKPIKLVNSVCVISPKQLTQERWQKSKVMRDLVHLADTIILNKIDQSSDNEINQAQQILNGCYPKKANILKTKFAKTDLKSLLKPVKQLGFNILAKTDNNLALQQLEPNPKAFDKSAQQQAFSSSIPQVLEAYVSYTNETNNTLASIGWVWQNRVQFNRVILKQFFSDYAPHLLRAKGVLKTGNEWQLLQFSEDNHTGLNLGDIAWRKDSRLQLLFKNQDLIPITIEELETAILSCIHTK